MLSVILAVAVVILDQLSKIIVVNSLKPVGSIPIIKNVLNLTYVENTGAAFGTLSDNRVVFMVASVAIIALLCFIVYRFHGKSRLFDICMGLILGGGVGNMIDRVRLGYVVDFIDFCAFDFWKWVFNIADSAVVVGCILAVVFVIFDKNTAVFDENKKETNVETDDEQ